MSVKHNSENAHFLHFLKSIGLGLFLLNCLACSNSDKIEGVRISEEKMKLILIDIHRAEATISAMGYRNLDSAKRAFKNLEKDILSEHEVSKEDYVSSFRLYAQNLDAFERIYQGVQDSLIFEQTVLKTYEANNTRKRKAKEEKVNQAFYTFKELRERIDSLKAHSPDSLRLSQPKK